MIFWNKKLYIIYTWIWNKKSIKTSKIKSKITFTHHTIRLLNKIGRGSIPIFINKRNRHYLVPELAKKSKKKKKKKSKKWKVVDQNQILKTKFQNKNNWITYYKRFSSRCNWVWMCRIMQVEDRPKFFCILIYNDMKN